MIRALLGCHRPRRRNQHTWLHAAQGGEPTGGLRAAVVRLALHDLGREEGGRAAEAVKVLVARDEDAGAAKVGELDDAVAREQDVLGLEVAVDDLLRVQVLERAQDVAEVVPACAAWARQAMQTLQQARRRGAGHALRERYRSHVQRGA
jgi:hypothetical protein